jgi:spore coat polysaccharide biosynthesis protein SpsF
MKRIGMKIVATIEARMTSTRLPGKVLLPAASKPMLEHLVNRLRRVPSIDAIVLATTVNDTDQVLVDFAAAQKINCFRGSEADVMSRVMGAGESSRADLIVEITGDCPIIDPLIIEQTIQMFLHNRCDYCSNCHIRTYPMGMETQVFRLDTLKRSYAMTSDPLDQEHVTRHIRLHPEMFTHVTLVAPPDLFWPELGLTLDEPADYELLTKIIEYFADKNPNFGCREVIELLRRHHPEWVEINTTVRRKGINQ